MTCIAWDGRTLAADRRATRGTVIAEVTKIFKVRDVLVGCSGDAQFHAALREWVRAERKPEEYPTHQRDKDDWQPMLVIESNGSISFYERSPYPIRFHDKHFAIGSGRDFALAAMHLGLSSEAAVGVACCLDSGCGNGIDTLTLD